MGSFKNSMQNTRPKTFLFILFGKLEFDPRAKRTAEILSGFGDILLFDLYSTEALHVNPHFKKVERLYSSPFTQANKVSRHLRFWLAVWWIAWRSNVDVVVAENFLTIFPGWVASKIARARLIYDAYELIIPEQGKPMSLRDKLWYCLERWSIKFADLVIAANPERAHIMAEHYYLPETPEYLRNISKQPKFGKPLPTSIAKLYPTLFPREERKMIFYQGLVSLNRGLARFVEAMQHLPNNYQLVIAGGGPDVGKIQALAEDLINKGQFIHLGFIAMELMPTVTSFADVGIITYSYEGLNNLYCAPNKIYEYIQAGAPVVSTDQPPLKALLKEFCIGELVTKDDSAVKIAEKIQMIVEKSSNYQKQMPKFLSSYNWENETLRVHQRIKKVLDNNERNS